MTTEEKAKKYLQKIGTKVLRMPIAEILSDFSKEQNKELVEELKAQKEVATEYSRRILGLEEYIAQMKHNEKCDEDLDEWVKGKKNPYKKSNKY